MKYNDYIKAKTIFTEVFKINTLSNSEINEKYNAYLKESNYNFDKLFEAGENPFTKYFTSLKNYTKMRMRYPIIAKNIQELNLKLAKTSAAIDNMQNEQLSDYEDNLKNNIKSALSKMPRSERAQHREMLETKSGVMIEKFKEKQKVQKETKLKEIQNSIDDKKAKVSRIEKDNPIEVDVLQRGYEFQKRKTDDELNDKYSLKIIDAKNEFLEGDQLAKAKARAQKNLEDEKKLRAEQLKDAEDRLNAAERKDAESENDPDKKDAKQTLNTYISSIHALSPILQQEPDDEDSTEYKEWKKTYSVALKDARDKQKNACTSRVVKATVNGTITKEQITEAIENLKGLLDDMLEANNRDEDEVEVDDDATIKKYQDEVDNITKELDTARAELNKIPINEMYMYNITDQIFEETEGPKHTAARNKVKALELKLKKAKDKLQIAKGEEPSKEEPSKEEPSKEEPSKEEPSKEEPSKEEPSKEELDKIDKKLKGAQDALDNATDDNAKKQIQKNIDKYKKELDELKKKKETPSESNSIALYYDIKILEYKVDEFLKNNFLNK